MKATRIVLVVAVVLALAGCTSFRSEVVEGSTVSVASSDQFTSYNSATSYGRTKANIDVAYATNSGFNYYGKGGTLVRDESFGRYEKLSDDPLVVQYTIADGVTWSDGTAIDASDLLLQWAATSGALNDPDFDPGEFIDPATGTFGDDYPNDVVFFDSGQNPGSLSGIGLVGAMPEVSDDLKSITMTYDRPFADWQLDFWGLTNPGLPSHVIARKALGENDPQEAKRSVLDAIRSKDTRTLAKISQFWNSGYNLSEMPKDRALLVGSGPYVVTAITPGKSVTLSANARYSGRRTPTVETIDIYTLPDPLAQVQALDTGEVQVASPRPSADVLSSLDELELNVDTSSDATFEHLDLQFRDSKSGAFDDPVIRQAFLKTVPRQRIVDEVLKPLKPNGSTRDSFLFRPDSEGYDGSIADNGSAAYTVVDTAGATELLAEAGVPAPEVCILYDPTNPRRAAEFSLIQESAGEAGFSVTDCSSPNWRDVLGTAGTYDAALFAWNPSTLGSTAATAHLVSDSPTNSNRFSDSKTDSLLRTLEKEFDPAKQVDIETAIDARLYELAYGLPLFQYPTVIAYDPKAIENLAPLPVEPTLFWNVWEWKTTPQ